MKKKSIQETRKASSTESALLQATIIQIMNKQAEVWMDGQTLLCALPGVVMPRYYGSGQCLGKKKWGVGNYSQMPSVRRAQLQSDRGG